MNPFHQHWMSHSIKIAGRGRGAVSPNPLVGACVVKKNRLIAEGYHARFGGPHAEVMALRRAAKQAKGAVLYVSLEPCSTFGKTPPCTDLILASGVKEVIVGSPDPNPKNFKKGIQILKRAGIQVKSGILADEVRRQNEAFFTFHEKHRPFVIVKIAESLDGKITTVSRSREWISSEESRKWTHELREQVDAVLVGTLTVKIDNPRMTPYLLNSRARRKPIRVVLDRKLELAENFHVFDGQSRTIVLASEREPQAKIERYASRRKVEVYPVRESQGKLDVRVMLKVFYDLGITSLLIEGGGEIIASFLHAKAVDKVCVFIAPFILGGRHAVTSVEGDGVRRVKDAIRLKEISTSRIGEDWLIQGYVHGNR